MTILIRKLNPHVRCCPEPIFADSDTYSLLVCFAPGQHHVLPAGQSQVYGTGIAIEVQNPKIAALVYPNPDLSQDYQIYLRKLITDKDTGEIQVELVNESSTQCILIHELEIARLIFADIIKPEFEIINDFPKTTSRNPGCASSTGHR